MGIGMGTPGAAAEMNQDGYYVLQVRPGEAYIADKDGETLLNGPHGSMERAKAALESGNAVLKPIGYYSDKFRKSLDKKAWYQQGDSPIIWSNGVWTLEKNDAGVFELYKVGLSEVSQEEMMNELRNRTANFRLAGQLRSIIDSVEDKFKKSVKQISSTDALSAALEALGLNSVMDVDLEDLDKLEASLRDQGLTADQISSVMDRVLRETGIEYDNPYRSYPIIEMLRNAVKVDATVTYSSQAKKPAEEKQEEVVAEEETPETAAVLDKLEELGDKIDQVSGSDEKLDVSTVVAAIRELVPNITEKQIAGIELILKMNVGSDEEETSEVTDEQVDEETEQLFAEEETKKAITSTQIRMIKLLMKLARR